jgi:hypothetical protein
MAPSLVVTPAAESGRTPFPVAEDLEESVAGFGLDRFGWKSTQGPNRLPHLFQIRTAPGALRQMGFEPDARANWQSIL